MESSCPVLDGLLASVIAPDKSGVVEWISENVRLPHSARSTEFDASVAPWLTDILRAVQDDAVRQIVVCAPTGGAKTTLLEVLIPFIVARQPGPMLLVGQNDETSKEWAESRLIPVLDSCPPVARLFPADRHQKRKTSILFPHMPLFISGANMSSLQEKSMRYCYGDEVWQWKEGMVGELKKRHHDRWNRKTILVSQGADEGSDFDKEALSGERHEWCYTCSGCKAQREWTWAEIQYDEVRTEDGGWRWKELGDSVRHVCGNCGNVTPNTTAARRAMCDASKYRVEPGNTIRGNVTFHYPAWAIWWIDWADLVREWILANEAKKKGEFNELKQFLQKRGAQMWKPVIDAPEVALVAADYLKTDFADGQQIEGEVFRFLTVDTQRDHFWALCRAWRADGSSQLIWEGKVLTIETIVDLGRRLKVRDKMTFIDAQYATGSVYDWAARFKFTALHGSGRDGFTHIGPRGNMKKFFSPMKTASAPSGGTAAYIYWCNEPMKDTLVKLRSRGSPHWEFPSDVSKDYLEHLNSEVKRDVMDKETKRMKMRWVRIGSRQNHLWDCEAMQVAVATMLRVLRDEPQTVGVDSPADKL